MLERCVVSSDGLSKEFLIKAVRVLRLQVYSFAISTFFLGAGISNYLHTSDGRYYGKEAWNTSKVETVPRRTDAVHFETASWDTSATEAAFGSVGQWYSGDAATLRLPFVCETHDVGSCGAGWIHSDGSCYKVFKEESTFFEAQRICADSRGPSRRRLTDTIAVTQEWRLGRTRLRVQHKEIGYNAGRKRRHSRNGNRRRQQQVETIVGGHSGQDDDERPHRWLATIRSEEQNEAVQRACGHLPCWIGLHQGGDDQWNWSDGSVVNYSNWNELEPGNLHGRHAAAAFFNSNPSYFQSGDRAFGPEWFGGSANMELHSVCEMDVGPQETCPHDWDAWHDSCYLVVREKLTLQDAKWNCEELGGHLAYISSETENLKVHLLCGPTAPCWIGLETTEDGWVWMDNSNVAYSNWDEGQPAAGSGAAFIGYGEPDSHSSRRRLEESKYAYHWRPRRSRKSTFISIFGNSLTLPVNACILFFFRRSLKRVDSDLSPFASSRGALNAVIFLVLVTLATMAIGFLLIELLYSGGFVIIHIFAFLVFLQLCLLGGAAMLVRMLFTMECTVARRSLRRRSSNADMPHVIGEPVATTNDTSVTVGTSEAVVGMPVAGQSTKGKNGKGDDEENEKNDI